MSAVVAYTRVSTDDQTCENQRRTISASAALGKSGNTSEGLRPRRLRNRFGTTGLMYLSISPALLQGIGWTYLPFIQRPFRSPLSAVCSARGWIASTTGLLT